MITDEQICVACAAYDSSDVAHSQLAAMRKALEAYEQSKWVKFDIPCDICEKELDYHPKHFSSSTNPHVHVCDACISELNYERFFIDSAPPTREPLSEELLMALAEECTAQFFNGVHQNATIHFARAIEQAHGIGVTK